MPRTLPSTGLRLEALEARDVPATLTVDDSFNPANLKANQYVTIQAAIDAAGVNDTVRVRAGTYAETVTVGAAKSGLRLLGTNATIKPGEASPFALVDIDGAKNVTVEGFTVAGPLAGAPAAGIAVERGASATIRNNTITDIAANPLNGVNSGNAVQVTDSTAVVENNTIVRYQKTGVVIDGATASATVRGNTILGVGPTAVIGQNGVQVSDGASASIDRNTISGNVYTPEGVEGAGIYLIQAGSVSVTGNRLLGNEVGLLIESQTAGVFASGNTILGSTRDGVNALNSSNLYLVDNRVAGSGRDGVHLEGVSGSFVGFNTVTGNGRDGVNVTGASSKNVVALNRLVNNGRYDALDNTTGSGTAGTADFWLANTIRVSGTPGLR